MSITKRTAVKMGWKFWNYCEASEIVPLVAKKCVDRHGQVLAHEEPKCDPLWDGCKVFKLDRTLLPTYLARIDEADKGKLASPKQPSKAKSDACESVSVSSLLERMKEDAKNTPQSADHNLFLQTKGIKTWDFNNYTLFNLGGEICDEEDFNTLGIRPKYKTIASSIFVSGVPVAVIRLGPSIPEIKPRTSDKHCPDSFQLPLSTGGHFNSYEESERDDEASDVWEGNRFKNKDKGVIYRVERARSAKNLGATIVDGSKAEKRRVSRNIRKSKKIKLEAVLGMFN